MLADFGHFKLQIYDQYIHQKHSCSWSLKLIFSGFEVLMSTSKLQSMSFELRLEIFFRSYQWLEKISNFFPLKKTYLYLAVEF